MPSVVLLAWIASGALQNAGGGWHSVVVLVHKHVCITDTMIQEIKDVNGAI